MAVNNVGTWCIVIDKRILTACCPISSCIYKSVIDGRCTYTKAKNSNVQELAVITGRSVPADETVQEIKQQLATAIKAAL